MSTPQYVNIPTESLKEIRFKKNYDILNFQRFWDNIITLQLDPREHIDKNITFRNKFFHKKKTLERGVKSFYKISGYRDEDAAEEISKINKFHEEQLRLRSTSLNKPKDKKGLKERKPTIRDKDSNNNTFIGGVNNVINEDVNNENKADNSREENILLEDPNKNIQNETANNNIVEETNETTKNLKSLGNSNINANTTSNQNTNSNVNRHNSGLMLTLLPLTPKKKENILSPMSTQSMQKTAFGNDKTKSVNFITSMYSKNTGKNFATLNQGFNPNETTIYKNSSIYKNTGSLPLSTKDKTFFTMTKSRSTCDLLPNTMKTMKASCDRITDLSDFINESLSRQIDKINKEIDDTKAGTGRIELNKDIDSIMSLEKNKKKHVVKLKPIKGIGNGVLTIIKESTANIMAYGDCFFKVDDNTFIKNQKNFVKGYPKVRVAAGINLPGEEEEEVKKKPRYFERNTEKIKQLVYTSNEYFKEVLNKYKYNKNYK